MNINDADIAPEKLAANHKTQPRRSGDAVEYIQLHGEYIGCEWSGGNKFHVFNMFTPRDNRKPFHTEEFSPLWQPSSESAFGAMSEFLRKNDGVLFEKD